MDGRGDILGFVRLVQRLPASVIKALYFCNDEERQRRLRALRSKAERELQKRSSALSRSASRAKLCRDGITLKDGAGYLEASEQFKSPEFLPPRDRAPPRPNLPQLLPRTSSTAPNLEVSAPPGLLAPELRALYMMPSRRDQIRLEGRERDGFNLEGVERREQVIEPPNYHFLHEESGATDGDSADDESHEDESDNEDEQNDIEQGDFQLDDEDY
ncbi:sister chromatid cohesion protein 1 [Rhodotorula toruloides]